MKVLFITPYSPARDGLATYSEMLCGELDRQGHAVRVIAVRRGQAPPDEVVGIVPVRPGGEATLAATVRGFDPDIVHLQFAVAAYGARLRSLLLGLRRLRDEGRVIVVTLHEITRDLETLGAPGRFIYRRVVNRAHRVIVHTEPARAAVSELVNGRKEAVVIAHPQVKLPVPTVGVEELRSRYGLGHDRVVLSFGFIHVDKGLDDLLTAAGRLRAEGRLQDVRLVFAGEVRRRFGLLRPFELRDRLYLRRLHRMVASEGLGDHVVFTGYVPSGEVRSWFELATLAVLPYRRIEQSGAGSLARGAGTPLLTTEVGELAKLGTFEPVAPADPPALAAALKSILAEDDHVNHRGSTDDLWAIVRQTTDLYAGLVAGASA